MHMADALISPAVGGVMLAVGAGTIAYSVSKVKEDLDEKKIPLMGVMGAFVFSAQMINFTIPATGSSGHMGGGILLAALLGPYAGFLVITSVLLIQALFFGDGGLLALGCNMFNMGFLTCFLAYPLIYKPILKKGINPRNITIATFIAVVIGLQLGAFSVVLETLISGKTELPFTVFVALMQPIHLAIGAVEGIVVSAVLCFIYKFNPEILENALNGTGNRVSSIRKALVVLLVAALVTGGMLSWFASENPDGLEWAISNVTGSAELEAGAGIHQIMGAIQEKLAFLPDYGFKNADDAVSAKAGTTTAGVVGGLMTLGLAALTGVLITKVKGRKHAAIKNRT
jgi:cobalt/nickel transport system permease protein